MDATRVICHRERLRVIGLAWYTAYDAAKSATAAYGEVRCRARTLESVSLALAGMPWVFTSTRPRVTSISWRRSPPPTCRPPTARSTA
ncbi:hypothetical protein AB0D13_15745 [Streptomyces sp. NPDC048430]|uniref:hypothetical protein n=1 Tax=unclassified Streptomyces TaxID=2593676 RepID=UPI00342C6511